MTQTPKPEDLGPRFSRNTGSNLSDMKNDYDADNRDRINRAVTTPPMKPKSFDMTLMDDTPFETPQYEQSIVSDLSGIINHRLYFEEQENMISLIINNSKLKTSNNKQFNI